MLDDMQAPTANEAWHDVMLYEEHLAKITDTSEITGGIARVGAVRAALATGQRQEATRLASQYLAEDALPHERRVAIERVRQENQECLI